MADVRHAVLVFGEILIDRFPSCEALGGAPFNVAWPLRNFGCTAILVSRIGQDAAGTRLLQTMESGGLATHGVQLDSSHSTGVVEVRVTPEGHQFVIVDDQAYDHIHPRLARMTALAANPEMVYFGTLAQRAGSHRALRHMLRAASGQRFFDVNLRDPWVDVDRLHWSLQQADIVKTNDDELARIARLMDLGEKIPDDQARALIRQYRLSGVLVTCGAAGAWWLDESERKEVIGSEPLSSIVDTVGAGDAFSAVFMFGRLNGWTPAVILQRANRFAGEICGIRGAIPDSNDFYQPFIDEWLMHL